jgi:hypothetical protein
MAWGGVGAIKDCTFDGQKPVMIAGSCGRLSTQSARMRISETI